MKKINLLLICCFLLSCKQTIKENTESPVTYTVDYSDSETFDWFSHMDITEVIPLEFSDSSILSVAKNCIIEKDKILFQDYKQRMVFVFDKAGKYLYSINKLGNGPDEYTDIWDLRTTWNHKEIMINDGHKLLFYNLQDGSYTHHMDLGFNSKDGILFRNCINPEENVFYLWSNNGEYTLYEYKDGELTGLKKRNGYELITKRFSNNYNNEYLVFPDYGEYGIDKINGGKYLFIDFGKYALPADMRPQKGSDLNKIEKSHYFKHINNVVESKDGIFISAISPQTNHYEIYIDKKSGNILKGNWDQNAKLNVLQAEDNFFYALVYPEYLQDDSKLKIFLQKYTNGDDNPLILKFKVTDKK